MNTEEGNKLIAEFMGLKGARETVSGLSYYDKLNNLTPIQYHTSWDWLMAVVGKIDNLQTTDFEDLPNWILSQNKWTVTDLTLRIPINRVWDAVVKFIEWYNQQQSAKASVASKSDTNSGAGNQTS